MEIFLIILFFIIGIYNSFLKGILHSLTQDFVLSKIDLLPNAKERIENLWDNYDKFNDTLSLAEQFFLLLSSILFGTVLLEQLSGFSIDTLLIFSVSVIAYLLITITSKSLAFAVGRKTAFNLFIPNLILFGFFSTLAHPLYLLSNKILKFIQGKSGLEDDSREEITAAVESAREEGSLDDDEYRILKNIMRFSDVLVSDVMTPRTVIFSLFAERSVSDTVGLPEVRMYSRFPIWEGESLDDGIIGYVMSKDLLQAALQGKRDTTLKELKREVYYIPENAQLDTALDMFLNRRQHLFVVVDEYGGVEGLLTMEDVLETMLGVEIVDEADRFVDMRLLAKQRRDRRISVVSSEVNE